MDYIFEADQPVEITGRKPHSVGSFFPTVIVSRLTHTEYLVRYNDNAEFVGGHDFLEETIHGTMLRPQPPAIQHPSSYVLGDRVEFLAYGAWWKGHVVSSVSRPPSTYMIRLPLVGVTMWALSARMRLYMEWRRGRWHVQQCFLQFR